MEWNGGMDDGHNATIGGIGKELRLRQAGTIEKKTFLLTIDKRERVRKAQALTGSSASVSVSPAPSKPGVVLMLFGPLPGWVCAPNSRARKLSAVFDMEATAEAATVGGAGTAAVVLPNVG